MWETLGYVKIAGNTLKSVFMNKLVQRLDSGRHVYSAETCQHSDAQLLIIEGLRSEKNGPSVETFPKFRQAPSFSRELAGSARYSTCLKARFLSLPVGLFMSRDRSRVAQDGSVWFSACGAVVDALLFFLS